MLFKNLHFEATPMQRKLELFTMSLQQLANQGGQIGPNKQRLHAWLRSNNLSLVEPVILGSNLSGGVSQCRLTDLVTMVDTLAIEETILTSISSDRELDQYLGGDEFSCYQLVNLLYPEIKRRASDAELDDLFDVLPVDVESVKSYIVWLSTEAELITLQKKNQALRQARIILAIASVMNGYYLQRKKPSDFGRLYYEGVSVQNINKELRRAVLGDCWEYDIRSSVVAWKMGWAKQYISARGQGADLRKVFSATLSFLEDKANFMATVRHFTFDESSPVPRDLQPKLLKQAFTAISFGARVTTHGWQNESGGWSNPALVDIIRNSADRDRFLNDLTVQAFIHEQGILDAHLYERVKVQRRDLLSKPFLQTPSGRPSKSKILAYLYQHDETEVMDVVCAVAETNRAPFDLGEAESELVAGFHTEYSGMKFALFMLGEYVAIVTMCALMTILFFGGWLGPWLPPIVWFSIKVFALICFFILLRAAIPRPRYDQLMALGWKVMLPLTLLNLLLTGVIALLLEGA